MNDLAGSMRRWQLYKELEMADLKGQIALVTGASRGLGRAIALELGAQGATVVGTATTDPAPPRSRRRFDAMPASPAGAWRRMSPTPRPAKR
jgi:hypothetical protein